MQEQKEGVAGTNCAQLCWSRDFFKGTQAECELAATARYPLIPHGMVDREAAV